ncbi:unnamed protein product [Protopolystoma xenopodis]|uniref:Fork-head domain-containing protein n=1 Tax=Protopolystoma xenopodis TaxID=117903 RepID=A0A448XFM3_9PLAT|nr:unnamed protein product [Protopolystoma xenopodis]
MKSDEYYRSRAQTWSGADSNNFHAGFPLPVFGAPGKLSQEYLETFGEKDGCFHSLNGGPACELCSNDLNEIISGIGFPYHGKSLCGLIAGYPSVGSSSSGAASGATSLDSFTVSSTSSNSLSCPTTFFCPFEHPVDHQLSSTCADAKASTIGHLTESQKLREQPQHSYPFYPLPYSCSGLCKHHIPLNCSGNLIDRDPMPQPNYHPQHPQLSCNPRIHDQGLQYCLGHNTSQVIHSQSYTRSCPLPPSPQQLHSPLSSIICSVIHSTPSSLPAEHTFPDSRHDFHTGNAGVEAGGKERFLVGTSISSLFSPSHSPLPSESRSRDIVPSVPLLPKIEHVYPIYQDLLPQRSHLETICSTRTAPLEGSLGGLDSYPMLVTNAPVWLSNAHSFSSYSHCPDSPLSPEVYSSPVYESIETSTNASVPDNPGNGFALRAVHPSWKHSYSFGRSWRPNAGFLGTLESKCVGGPIDLNSLREEDEAETDTKVGSRGVGVAVSDSSLSSDVINLFWTQQCHQFEQVEASANPIVELGPTTKLATCVDGPSGTIPSDCRSVVCSEAIKVESGSGFADLGQLRTNEQVLGPALEKNIKPDCSEILIESNKYPVNCSTLLHSHPIDSESLSKASCVVLAPNIDHPLQTSSSPSACSILYPSLSSSSLNSFFPSFSISSSLPLVQPSSTSWTKKCAAVPSSNRVLASFGSSAGDTSDRVTFLHSTSLISWDPKVSCSGTPANSKTPAVTGLSILPCKKSARRNPWGSETYSDLISNAIHFYPEQQATLQQIYDFIINRYSYFRERSDPSSSSGWKVSLETSSVVFQIPSTFAN